MERLGLVTPNAEADTQAGMMARPLAALVLALALVAGCARGPAPEQFFSAPELSELVTGRTLHVAGCCEAPTGTLLYLAKDGTGWLDSRLVPGAPATPSGMSMVLTWRVVDGSRVCLWATPRIADMPSFAPPFSECVQVLRSREATGGLIGVVMREGSITKGALDVYPSSVFPAAAIDQYLVQVRVLYGGHVPAWSIPATGMAEAAFVQSVGGAP